MSMKGLTIIFGLICIALSGFGQDEIKISNQFEDGLVVNGYKKGVWNYFDHSGDMVLQVNYDNAKILYVQPTTNRFYIKKEGKWTYDRVDKQALFLGSPIEMDNFLNDNIRFPEEALKSFSSGKTIVSFVVDKTGSAGQFEVVKDFGFEAGNEVVRVLDEMPNLWIPSEKNGEIVDTKFFVSVIFEGKEPLVDEQLLAADPEIPNGQAQLNVAPSVNYYRSYTISSGNGMTPKTRRM